MEHCDLAKAVRIIAASRANEMLLHNTPADISHNQRSRLAYRHARAVSGLSRYQFTRFVRRINRRAMSDLVATVGMNLMR
jgi:hypothetical protein